MVDRPNDCSPYSSSSSSSPSSVSYSHSQSASAIVTHYGTGSWTSAVVGEIISGRIESAQPTEDEGQWLCWEKRKAEKCIIEEFMGLRSSSCSGSKMSRNWDISIGINLRKGLLGGWGEAALGGTTSGDDE